MDLPVDPTRLPGPAPGARVGPSGPPAAGPASAAPVAFELFDEDHRPGRPRHPSEFAPAPPAAESERASERPVDLDRWRPPGRDDAPEIEFGWADLLDLINPLQHIPVVSTLYRALTGDEIAAPARVAGGALFGGPIGFVAGIVQAAAAEAIGRDPGQAALAALFGEDEVPATAVAASDPAPAPGPESDPDQVVTGQAALAALANDLRTAGGAAPGSVQAGAAAVAPVSAEAPGERDAGTPTAPDARLLGAAAPDYAFTERMLLGLEKYRAMTRERGGPGRPNPARLDRSL